MRSPRCFSSPSARRCLCICCCCWLLLLPLLPLLLLLPLVSLLLLPCCCCCCPCWCCCCFCSCCCCPCCCPNCFFPMLLSMHVSAAAEAALLQTAAVSYAYVSVSLLLPLPCLPRIVQPSTSALVVDGGEVNPSEASSDDQARVRLRELMHWRRNEESGNGGWLGVEKGGENSLVGLRWWP